jgi:predicted peptidase
MNIKKGFILVIFLICTFLVTGYKDEKIIIDASGISKNFTPSYTSIYHPQIKPYNKFLRTQTINIKEDIYVTKHIFGNYTFYEKTNKLMLWDKDISLNGEWFENGVLMPYGLFSPSKFCKYDKLPLIVYLHGSGSMTKTAEHFMSHGVQKLFQEWEMDGFSSYIVCPQLSRGFNSGSWKNKTSKQDLQNLLDYLLDNYNIDKNRVYIMGHSMGGQGALYMAHELSGYFAACVSISPYSPGVDVSEITIPVRSYLGYDESGEDERCVKYATKLKKIFGENTITFFHCTHGQAPLKTFTQDENHNNKPDVLEWLFVQYKT